MTNCVNCGAPLHGNVCEYCGTYFGIDYGDKNGDMTVYVNCDVDESGLMKIAETGCLQVYGRDLSFRIYYGW